MAKELYHSFTSQMLFLKSSLDVGEIAYALTSQHFMSVSYNYSKIKWMVCLTLNHYAKAADSIT